MSPDPHFVAPPEVLAQDGESGISASREAPECLCHREKGIIMTGPIPSRRHWKNPGPLQPSPSLASSVSGQASCHGEGRLVGSIIVYSCCGVRQTGRSDPSTVPSGLTTKESGWGQTQRVVCGQRIGFCLGDGGGGFGRRAHSSTFVGLCFDLLDCVLIAQLEGNHTYSVPFLCPVCGLISHQSLQQLRALQHLPSDGRPGIRTRH